MDDFAARIPIGVQNADQIAQRIGPGGMFVPTETPAPMGAEVAVDFVGPDGATLSRVVCRVRDTAAVIQGLRGMTLEVLSLDRVAQAVLKQHAQLPGSDAIEATRQRVDNVNAFFSAGDGPVVGIDLGTTNSCVAIVENGEPRVIPTPEGYETLPSILYLTPEKHVVVGHRAREKMLVDPTRAIYGSKRFMGRPFTENEVRAYGHFFRWELAPDKRGHVAARIDNVVVSLEVVAAAILKQLKEMAEAHLGVPVKRAVVTVPAYFGERQRQAVAQAGSLAGLVVERIVNEPTAGAVAYGYGRGLSSTVLVYDLGGGTFDASVLRIEGDRMEVLATDGGPFLGGSDFDDRLTEYVFHAIDKEHHVDLRGNALIAQRVRMEAEKVKLALSEAEHVQLDLPYLVTEGDRQISLSMTVGRDLLEELTRDLVDRTLVIVQSVLDVAGITSARLDDVIMIGGQSRSPIVRRRLQERFGRQPTRRVHPDLAVALGAAIVAGGSANLGTHAKRTEVVLTDVLPASIRLARPDGSSQIVLKRGDRLPVVRTVETEALRIALYRGEVERVTDLEPVGAIDLDGRWPAGGVVELTVIVNAQGLMTVTAENPSTGDEEELEVSLLNDKDVRAPDANTSFFAM